ncbi:hypothetical protein IAT38_007647 [Cryptococcus sp. DSM 104549]
MPLHLPHLGRHSHKDSDKAKAETPAYIPRVTSPAAEHSSSPISQSPASTPSLPRPVSFADNRSSSVVSGGGSNTNGDSSIHGILRNPASPSLSGWSDATSPSASGSGSGPTSPFANMHRRIASLSFDRSETIESRFSLEGDGDQDTDREHEPSSPSTPGTSVSSLSHFCPLPPSSSGQRLPFFMMTISSVSTLSFVALPLGMRPIVLDSVGRAWKRGVSKIQEVDYQPELKRRHKEKGCEGGVWEVTMKGEAWMPMSSEQVSSKRILINLLTDFAREGYDLTSSFRTSAKDSGKDTLMFLRSSHPPDPDPIFFAVAFHSHDRIWIIDAEADVGEAVEEGIKSWWVDGVRDTRTRERHCRELRLRGAPWTAHTTTALISARCIHLTIMKIITHCSMGYDFVGSVEMADKEEGEMPVTFYRRRWGTSTRAVWSVQDHLEPGSGKGSVDGSAPESRTSSDDVRRR